MFNDVTVGFTVTVTIVFDTAVLLPAAIIGANCLILALALFIILSYDVYRYIMIFHVRRSVLNTARRE